MYTLEVGEEGARQLTPEEQAELDEKFLKSALQELQRRLQDGENVFADFLDEDGNIIESPFF